MPRLTDNRLRTRGITTLLKDLGVKDGTTVNCMDELVILRPVVLEEIDDLATKLQTILQTETTKPSIQRFSLQEFLEAEINTATGLEQELPQNRALLCAMLPHLVVNPNLRLDEEQGNLIIKLPLSMHVLLRSLAYQHMTIDGDYLIINLQKLVKEQPETLILIQSTVPLLLSNASQFAKRKVFYAQEQISENEVEIRPHLFIPSATKPPRYRFVMDTSTSMLMQTNHQSSTTRLQILQKSVLQFADALFEFQPEAIIDISQFNKNSSSVGSYTKQDKETLLLDIGALTASPGTCLFAEILKELDTLSDPTECHNLLVFTDGKNSVDDSEKLIQQLQEKIESLKQDSPLILARNKLSIISYNTEQPEILHQVTELFASLVIKTDAADFITALAGKEQLQEWVAARELFTCCLEVAPNHASASEMEEYTRAYNLSGQFVALKSIRCKNDEVLHVKVTDGNGDTLLDDQQSLMKQPVLKQNTASLLHNSAELAATRGFFSVDGKPNEAKLQEQGECEFEHII